MSVCVCVRVRVCSQTHMVTEELQALREHCNGVLRHKHGGHQLAVAADGRQHAQHALQQVQMGPAVHTGQRARVALSHTRMQAPLGPPWHPVMQACRHIQGHTYKQGHIHMLTHACRNPWDRPPLPPHPSASRAPPCAALTAPYCIHCPTSHSLLCVAFTALCRLHFPVSRSVPCVAFTALSHTHSLVSHSLAAV